MTFETCERRLVLSAQLLFDALGDQALDMHHQGACGPDSNWQSAGHADQLFGSSSIGNHGSLMESGSWRDTASAGLANEAAVSPELPLQSHLLQAHQQTGWDQVQSRYGLTGRGQTVAVIDSGIAWDHVALGGGFGDGYRVVGGWDFTEENDNQPYDDAPTGFHGTHVSGIIGSSDPEHTGVAPEVDLVALRVFNDLGQGQLSWVEQALQWVHDNQDGFENPITTVNLSLGTQWNSDTVPAWATLEDEFQALYQDGILVTASAGNSFQEYQQPGLSYPAASNYVLPVASVDDDGTLSDFSQRNERVLAAPGSQILSTVPDHVFGQDGQVNDFGTASGTSMAAPYVAGASVLVRQAMEMVEFDSINMDTIADHLRDTADSVFDTLTGTYYDRLNLHRAIDALLPDDVVGDSLQFAQEIELGQNEISGWINELGDNDVFSFTAATNGTLHLQADSQWADSLSWSLQTGDGQSVGSGGLGSQSIALIGGESYQLQVSAPNQIGAFSLIPQFDAASDQPPAGEGDSGGQAGASSGDGQSGGSDLPPMELGLVELEQLQTAGDGSYQAQATRDGTFTVRFRIDQLASDAWASAASPQLHVSVLNDSEAITSTWSDASWQDGELRIDASVLAGQRIAFQLTGMQDVTSELTVANVFQLDGSTARLSGTMQQDQIDLQLGEGASVTLSGLEYDLPANGIQQVVISGSGSNDLLNVQGSTGAEKVDLSPQATSIETSRFQVTVDMVEQVEFAGGGGADRIYLYDSDGDDTLTARPGSAELQGVGYRYQVNGVDRIFVHATGAGEDFAYLYDSTGDDALSVRPQFSSMSGDGFFNYVRGFERVYAYANSGGEDQATLYDSEGDDRFSTSGASASISGPGFSSFTRSFDEVEAIADAGGSDLATLYGSGDAAHWHTGSDFVRFNESGWAREARGFTQVDTFVGGEAFAVGEPATASQAVMIATDAPQHAVGFEHQASLNEIARASSSASEEASSAASIPSFGGHPSSYETLDSANEGSVPWGQQFQSEAINAPQEIDWLEEDRSAIRTAEDMLEDVVRLHDAIEMELQLPDAALLADPEREHDLLDLIFSEFDSEDPLKMDL